MWARALTVGSAGEVDDGLGCCKGASDGVGDQGCDELSGLA